MPDHVVRQAVDGKPRHLGEFGEPFGFDLVVDGFGGEVDA